MPFDLNTFMQRGMTYGGARVSKFDCILTLPTALQSMPNYSAATQKLTFTCKAASIPSCSIGEVALPYFGRKIKSAGDRVWDDWRITVMLDEDYLTRQMFEYWSNQINAFERNVMDQSLDGEGYKAAWDINHYAKDDTYIAQYTLNGAWPRQVGPISLDWDGVDRVAQFDVTVAFDWMNPGSNGTTSNTTSSVSTPGVFSDLGSITYTV